VIGALILLAAIGGAVYQGLTNNNWQQRQKASDARGREVSTDMPRPYSFSERGARSFQDHTLDKPASDVAGPRSDEGSTKASKRSLSGQAATKPRTSEDVASPEYVSARHGFAAVFPGDVEVLESPAYRGLRNFANYSAGIAMTKVNVNVGDYPKQLTDEASIEAALRTLLQLKLVGYGKDIRGPDTWWGTFLGRTALFFEYRLASDTGAHCTQGTSFFVRGRYYEIDSASLADLREKADPSYRRLLSSFRLRADATAGQVGTSTFVIFIQRGPAGSHVYPDGAVSNLKAV
jgi:hypothetical protein